MPVKSELLFRKGPANTRAPLESLPRQEQAPFGIFSRWVTHELSSHAERIGSYLVEPDTGEIDAVRYSSHLVTVPATHLRRLEREVTVSFATVSDETLSAVLVDPAQREVALLDMLTPDTVLAHFGIRPPERLANAIPIYARALNRIPVPTYHDLVHVNPLYKEDEHQDPRTFMPGTVGESERSFYLAHFLLEQELMPAVAGLWEGVHVLRTKGKEGVEQAVERLTTFNEKGKIAQKYLATLKTNMPNVHFQRFRAPFLFPHPLRNTHDQPMGPSGRHSGTFVEADFALLGSLLSAATQADYARILREGYYPPFQVPQIIQAFDYAKKGISLREICRELGDPFELKTAIGIAITRVNAFRLQHIATVNQHLPNVASGAERGTATEAGTTRDYLRGHLLIDPYDDDTNQLSTHALVQRILRSE